MRVYRIMLLLYECEIGDGVLLLDGCGVSMYDMSIVWSVVRSQRYACNAMCVCVCAGHHAASSRIIVG